MIPMELHEILADRQIASVVNHEEEKYSRLWLRCKNVLGD
jgi:hypothetical protein